MKNDLFVSRVNDQATVKISIESLSRQIANESKKWLIIQVNPQKTTLIKHLMTFKFPEHSHSLKYCSNGSSKVSSSSFILQQILQTYSFTFNSFSHSKLFNL
jgi:hypothetical protein